MALDRVLHGGKLPRTLEQAQADRSKREAELAKVVERNRKIGAAPMSDDNAN